jgi:thymidylate synthase (FAD)
MKVKLISYSNVAETMPESIDTIKDLVAYCARVSNPSNQLNTETSSKLLKYLIKHKHWSPFEMVNVCMEIETTRDIARQILRHRSFSFQEFSQRYANPLSEITSENDFEFRELRMQDPTNRQNSIKPTTLGEVVLEDEWVWRQQEVLRVARENYLWAINKGIAKEVARALLPEGLTVSRLLMNGTLRSWIHYIELRSANGTQKEHMDIANKCGKVIAEVYGENLFAQE